ncbi:NADH dehydrogenase [ubiquinone] 1 beta subcomplex subunit 7 [Sphaerulina musiva]
MTVTERIVDTAESVKEAVVGLSHGSTTRQATRQEMSDARLPLAYRDSCAHLLIPLNKCRYDNYYLNWRCQDERHSYEKCQYEEFKLRVKKMDEIRAQKGGQRSN